MKCASILFDGAPLQMVRVEHDMFLEVDSTTIVVPHYVYTCSHSNWPVMLFFHFANVCPSLLTPKVKEMINAWDRCVIDKKAIGSSQTNRMLTDARRGSQSSSKPNAAFTSTRANTKKRRKLQSVQEDGETDSGDAGSGESVTLETLPEDEPCHGTSSSGAASSSAWRPPSRPTWTTAWSSTAWTAGAWSAASWQTGNGEGIRQTSDDPTLSDVVNPQCTPTVWAMLLVGMMTVVALIIGACATYLLFPRRVTVVRTVRIWPDSVTSSRTGASYHRASTCPHLHQRSGVRTFTRCPDCEDDDGSTDAM